MNFSITYYLLNKLIFSPIIISLKKKKAVEDNFINSLKQEESILLAKGKKLHQDLTDFQRKIQKKYVPLPKKSLEVKFDITYERDEKEVKNLTKKIKDLLVEKIPHVR